MAVGDLSSVGFLKGNSSVYKMFIFRLKIQYFPRKSGEDFETVFRTSCWKTTFIYILTVN